MGGRIFKTKRIMVTLNELKTKYSNANDFVCRMRHQSIQALTDLVNNAEDHTIDLSDLEDKFLVSKVTTPPTIDVAECVYIENGNLMVGTEYESIDAYDCDAFDLALIAIHLLGQENEMD